MMTGSSCDSTPAACGAMANGIGSEGVPHHPMSILLPTGLSRLRFIGDAMMR